jgi:drug/metabolite transporter (DMT)-like permease
VLLHLPSCCSRLWHSGVVIITLAAIVCSTIALFIKQLHGSVPAVQITLISSCLSWLLTTAWLLLVGENWRSLVQRQVPLLVLRGALGAATSILYYQSIQMLRMNEAVTIFFTNPAMAALLDYLINNKAIRLGTVAGIALAISGVVLVGCPTCQFAEGFGSMSAAHLLGICYGLGGAAANAGGYIAVHKIGADVPFVVLMWW